MLRCKLMVSTLLEILVGIPPGGVYHFTLPVVSTLLEILAEVV